MIERMKKLETGLRLIQLHAGAILEADSRPGYELREFAEEVHAMAASTLTAPISERHEGNNSGAAARVD